MTADADEVPCSEVVHFKIPGLWASELHNMFLGIACISSIHSFRRKIKNVLPNCVGQMLVWWLIHHRFVLVPWIVAKPPRCKHTLTNQLHMISISNILRLFQFQSSALKAFYGVNLALCCHLAWSLSYSSALHIKTRGGHQRPWCQCLQRSMVPPWGALALATWPMIFWFHEFLLISLQLCCHSVLFLAALYDPEGSQSLSQTDSKFISLMPSLFLPPLKLWTLYYILLLCQYCWWPKQTAKFRSSKADGFSKSVVLQHWAWNLLLQVRN